MWEPKVFEDRRSRAREKVDALRKLLGPGRALTRDRPDPAEGGGNGS